MTRQIRVLPAVQEENALPVNYIFSDPTSDIEFTTCGVLIKKQINDLITVGTLQECKDHTVEIENGVADLLITKGWAEEVTA